MLPATHANPKMAVRYSRLSHSETAACFLPTFALSLAENDLTNLGSDMSGVIALAAALKDSKITHLKYGCPSSASHALCFLGYGTEPAVSLLKLLKILDVRLQSGQQLFEPRGW